MPRWPCRADHAARTNWKMRQILIRSTNLVTVFRIKTKYQDWNRDTQNLSLPSGLCHSKVPKYDSSFIHSMEFFWITNPYLVHARRAWIIICARAYENWNKLVLNEMKWYLGQVRDDSLVVYI